MITVIAVALVIAVPAGFALLWLRSDATLRRREAGILEQLAQLAAEVAELRAERDRARAAREGALETFRRLFPASRREGAVLTLDMVLEGDVERAREIAENVAAGRDPFAKAEPDPDDDAETHVYARPTLLSRTRRPS